MTVLRVEVSGDLHNATVFVSVMGTDAEQQLAMNGLKHATGFLQAKVAARLQTRFTPVLTFKHDDSVKKSIEMAQLDRRRPRRRPPRDRTGCRQAQPTEEEDEEEEEDEDDEQDTTTVTPDGPGTTCRAARSIARSNRVPHRHAPARPTLMASQSKAQFLNEVHALLKKRYKPKADRAPRGSRCSRRSSTGSATRGPPASRPTRPSRGSRTSSSTGTRSGSARSTRSRAALAGLPDPEPRAQRIRRFLRQLFEKTYGFNLEALTKKPLKESLKTPLGVRGVRVRLRRGDRRPAGPRRPRDPGRRTPPAGP